MYEVVNSLPEIGGCFIRVFYRYFILYSKIIVQQYLSRLKDPLEQSISGIEILRDANNIYVVLEKVSSKTT